MLNIKLDWEPGGIASRLDRLDDRLDGQVHAIFEYQRGHAESFMRTTAPWTDRTGNARQGLSGVVKWVPKKSHTLTVFHRMTYGIFLEVRWAGKYAIIVPTLQKFGPETMRMLQGLFGRLGGGA